MTNILIPSNFGKDTLECIPELLETFPGLKVNVLLFHAFGLSSSITELLMLSRRNKEEELICPSFWRGCVELEKKHPDELHAIQWTCFYGNTMEAFRNFLKANHIHIIVQPSNFTHQKIGKRSLNPLEFMGKCDLPVIPITIDANRVEFA